MMTKGVEVAAGGTSVSDTLTSPRNSPSNSQHFSNASSSPPPPTTRSQVYTAIHTKHFFLPEARWDHFFLLL